MDASSRRYRAGESLEDYCAACHTDRMHTIIVVDRDGRPLRVDCGFCHSQHNYRGGPRVQAASPSRSRPSGGRSPQALPPGREPLPIVSERERSKPAVTPTGDVDLELLLRRIIREEAGVSAVVPAEKWRGGTLVLRPGTPGTQETTWPIETFFHKVVMVRNRLRTLEQVVNASDLGEDAKVKLQAYISACYGSLTSFNVLFAGTEDRFKGTGGE